MRELTKDVVIGEHRYQISRMDAMTGSWIAMQMLTKLFPMNLEQMVRDAAEKEGTIASLPAMPSGRSELSEQDFHNIQTHCLKVCSRWEMVGTVDTPMPVLMANGGWAIKELQNDVVTVMTLTAHSLIFNISPFFEQGALTQVLESLSGLIPRPAAT